MTGAAVTNILMVCCHTCLEEFLQLSNMHIFKYSGRRQVAMGFNALKNRKFWALKMLIICINKVTTFRRQLITNTQIPWQDKEYISLHVNPNLPTS